MATIGLTAPYSKLGSLCSLALHLLGFVHGSKRLPGGLQHFFYDW